MPNVYSILEDIGAALEVKAPMKIPLSTGVVGGVAVLALGYTLRTLTGAVYTYVKKTANDKKRQEKRDACKRSIDDLAARIQSDPPSEKVVEGILKLKLPALIKKLKSGELSPLQVLKVYQIKALEAHARTNCLVEVIVEAETWAKELESRPKDGLLYGVPISIKEDVYIKGYDSTLGCVEYAGKPAKDDTAILKVLKRHGAIPFVRTNLPQLALSYEPGNPIFGTVLNPHNLKHGPGGSSSGEAAIVASGASLLGIGSDIGGSTRVPAHFTGICTLKPTVQRMSSVGHIEEYEAEQLDLEATFAPLAPDVDTVVLALRTLWDGHSLSALDPASVPLPFDNEVYTSKRKLKIGYYTEDGLFPVFSGCARAVMQAKAILEKNGHEVIPWPIPDVAKVIDFEYRFLAADGGILTYNVLKHDRIDPSIRDLYSSDIPYWVRWLVAKVLRPVNPELAQEAEYSLGLNSIQYWDVVQKLRDFAVEVTTEWTEAGIDAVICPPFAFASPPLGNPALCLRSKAYPMAYNVLNFPAGVVPMTKVSKEDIESLKDYPTTDKWCIKAKEAMEVAGGLPIGVMVAAPRFRDEMCLRLMKELEQDKLI